MANQKRIPFIPKLSREFKPMRHYYCETETTAKLISRSVFLRLLAEQPYPMGQVSIDFDGGFAYLFPYDPQRAEQFAAAYREFETEYKRFYRKQEDNHAGRRMTVVHLDQFDDTAAEGDDMQSTWLVSEETPESVCLAKEHFIIHSSSFNSLSDSEREILTGFINSDFNARELARRLGKDPSGVLKLIKRAAVRLEKNRRKFLIPCPHSVPACPNRKV